MVDGETAVVNFSSYHMVRDPGVLAATLKRKTSVLHGRRQYLEGVCTFWEPGTACTYSEMYRKDS